MTPADRTEIIEEFVAVVNGFKRKNSFKEQIHAVGFNFIDHIKNSNLP